MTNKMVTNGYKEKRIKLMGILMRFMIIRMLKVPLPMYYDL